MRYGCPACGAVFRTGFARCPLDGDSLQELAGDPLAGSTFADRYVIEDCIGEGGMGRVYRARHQRVSRRFAIKVLFGEHATDPKMRDRFSREAEAASRLSHPNVISVLDFGETDAGLLYLVMDYVEGRELSEVLADDAPLESRRIVEIGRQLALGLGHAHEEGLVHRDFKPENVIVTSRGGLEVPRIVDFGIAVLEEPDGTDHRLTTEGIILGTPAYMAPEQAIGSAIDSRTDLFALGVMIYQMLSGVGPFEGPPLAIARQNLSQPPPPIGERVPGLEVDPDLEAIARKLMAKKPERRFQSAIEVVAALERIGTGEAGLDPIGSATVAGKAIYPEPGEPLVPATELDGRAPRRLGPLIVILALVAAAGLALALALRNGDEERVAEGHVEPDAAALERDAATAEVAPAFASMDDAAALDPDPEPEVEPEPEPERKTRRKPRTETKTKTNSDTAGNRTEPAEAEPISQRSLTSLYVRVGEGIEALAKRRGEAEVASLRARFSRIPFQDALRKPAIRNEVEADLSALRRELRRIERR